jgi:hypothetical protein
VARVVPQTASANVARKGFAASPAQRLKCAGAMCIACGQGPGCHPAHVISRAALSEGQDDPLAVVPLCPPEHRLYDTGRLDLLPSLEAGGRDELAFAVKRYGLLRTLQRVTNTRWRPLGERARAA